MPALPRRALIAVTSASANLFPDENDSSKGEITGVFIGEALHPYNVLTAAGFEVDIASEKGVYTADWLSLQPGFLSDEERKQYDDKTSDFRKKLDAGLEAESLDGNNYGIFFASAGHAALIDYPHATALKAIASKVWENGGIVSSVCHGPAIFPGIIDSKTGKSIIEGKKITGFTREGEETMKLMPALESWGEPLIDTWAERLGATYLRDDDIWGDYNITDGRIVTGQNPQSAMSTAKAVVEAFEKL
ncbi:class I glutamine amidotransferase-like protein [Lophiotrema nucula]|uniref:D-lactate dehydratase n=1 Tax=Lophiotrema nucula TaxID=690887 RepID=A0A6A5YW71_9PLEO|nr:class I glutamine amidotransferase-like protein [Lophiotrema nucula]